MSYYYYGRPLGDMNHVTPDGHLVGISPSQPLTRSTSPPAVYHARPWTPPVSPAPLSAPPPSKPSSLSSSSRNHHHHHHQQHISPRDPPPSSPRPYAPGESTFLINLARQEEESQSQQQQQQHANPGGDETFEERRERARAVIPCAPNPPSNSPPPPPHDISDTLFALTHATHSQHPPMVLTSSDPFSIPPLPSSPASVALRLHLCPAPILLRALAIAAQHTSGFLTCDAFVHAVKHWSPRVDSGRASTFTPFLQSLYDHVLREAPSTSRNWTQGRSQVDFRLPGAALLPYLPITPPRERLGLVWGMWGGRVKVKEAVAALTAIAVGRVVGAMWAGVEEGVVSSSASPWRVTGGIERYARALVQAFCEDTKEGAGGVPLEGLLRWLHLRQVLVF